MRPMGEKFKKGSRTSGITLVELMMALIVMAIAIIGVVSVMLHSMKAKEITREFDIAKEAAATKLESMRSNKWDQGPGVAGVPDPDPYMANLEADNTIYHDWVVPGLNHKGWTFTPPLPALPITSTSGRGYIHFHNTTLGKPWAPSAKTADFNDNLLDLEVRVEWWGIDGFRTYSVRSMFTR